MSIVDRQEVVSMVYEMRDLWPQNTNLSLLDRGSIAKVETIQNTLCGMISNLGFPQKILNIQDLDMKADLEQEFWLGVAHGMTTVKSRLSPDDREDTNNPLYFLIAKGKWAVISRKRRNTRRAYQKCHVCDAVHFVFAPNFSRSNAVGFDWKLAKKARISAPPLVIDVEKHNKVRAFYGLYPLSAAEIEKMNVRPEDDEEVLRRYRVKILSEKHRRLSVKNICKECYNDGVKDWYPIYSPMSLPGDEGFEKDLSSINFMHPCIDMDLVEISMTDTSIGNDESVSFIENTDVDINGDEHDLSKYNDIEQINDISLCRETIFEEFDVKDIELYETIFDVVYGGSRLPCLICPRRAKLLVQNFNYKYDYIINAVAQHMNTSLDGLGDWPSLYSTAKPCGAVPSNDCDNLNERISSVLMIQPSRVKKIRDRLRNEVSAYLTITQIIGDVKSEQEKRKHS
jgi:hypothetical protein